MAAWQAQPHSVKSFEPLVTIHCREGLASSNMSSGGKAPHLKCVASCVLRTGSMSTSLTMTLMSEPEKPSVRPASMSKSAAVKLLGVSPRCTLNMCARAAVSGKAM